MSKKTPPTATEESLLDLRGTLGMYEMEAATARIIKRCKEHGSWILWNTYDHMVGRAEQRGFIHLVHRGLLQYAYYKDPFYVTQQLLDVVSCKTSFSKLSNRAPTQNEILDSQLNQKIDFSKLPPLSLAKTDKKTKQKPERKGRTP